MNHLLALSRLVDGLVDRVAVLAEWAVVSACAISAGNAIMRYSIDFSSNAFLEIQWYLFAACVMLGASHVLRTNEHVRVDILYGRWSPRTRAWIDLLGLMVFLLPLAGCVLYLAIPVVERMLVTGEMSGNAGGLVRWPAMATVPLGMGLLLLQGLSEIIKRVAWLRGLLELNAQYERPVQ